MCILTYRPRRKDVSNCRAEGRTEAISTKKGNFTRFCGSFFLSARRNQKIRAPLHPQKRVILPVFVEVCLFLRYCRFSLRQQQTTLKKGQVHASAEPKLPCATPSLLCATPNLPCADLQNWEQARTKTKSSPLLHCDVLPLFWGIKVRREGWFSILHFWKWRQGIIYMCREKEKPRLLLFGCVKSKELGFSGGFH